ncbi:hypothetical protein [Novosphingobium sp. THN1]|uniref:hypothetical protein n=1 Tax=Novosphingobium sp. THN1 TaxID=1016987 RepID=UPI001F072CE6|nr:hypothetical protein [Novosphingobium sp. THN1]
MPDMPYLARGIMPVETPSSVLVSSSKYLNNPRLRDWLAMILLRRNGPDLPPLPRCTSSCRSSRNCAITMP